METWKLTAVVMYELLCTAVLRENTTPLNHRRNWVCPLNFSDDFISASAVNYIKVAHYINVFIMLHAKELLFVYNLG